MRMQRLPWRLAGTEFVGNCTMIPFCRHHQEAKQRWRLAMVMSSVVALHAIGVWGWMASQSGVGQGAWSSARSAHFRVRATVLQEVFATQARDGEHQTFDAPVRQTAQVDKPLTQANGVLDAAVASMAGADTLWSPIPSDYLSDEQVDASPRPKDDWMLDWSQVPQTREAWRVTVRMWVSATGLVDHVETLDTQPAEAWVVKLLAPLAKTEMEPATLAGQPVPVTYVVQLAPEQLP